MSELSDQELLRYSRQIFLSEVDVDGQEKLKNAHVVIMGVGGLGALSASYLAGAGIATLTLVDDDEVDITNLHRQLLYTQDDVGKKKVNAAKDRLMLMNSDCIINTVDNRANKLELQKIFQEADLVLDGTDNFESRMLINSAAFLAGTPLLSAAVTQFSGQLSLFDYSEGSPCYQCLYPDVEDVENNCSENGVLGPSAGLIASMQSLHALKYLLGLHVESLHRLHIVDMLEGINRTIALQVDTDCKVCARMGTINN